MPGINYILDTSALIELYTQTEKGGKVLALIKNAQTIVPSIVVAELKSAFGRQGIESRVILLGIKESSRVLPLTFEVADLAGELHIILRKKISNISLADCIIMAHATIEEVMVVTTDHHFNDFKLAVVI